MACFRFTFLALCILAVVGDAAVLRGQPAAKGAHQDSHGDPLPSGAILRIGTTRLRHIQAVSQLCFTPDGKQLASLGADDVFSLWDLKTGAEVRRIPLADVQSRTDLSPERLLEMALLMRRQGRNLGWFSAGATISSDGKLLAASSAGKVRFFDLLTGKEPAPLTFKDGKSGMLAFSADAKSLARFTNRDDGETELAVVENPGGKVLHKLRLTYREQITHLAFSSDGKYLAGASSENINLWDLATGKRMRRYETREPVTALSFAPRSHRLASATSQGVYFWEQASEEETARFPLVDINSCAAAFSPDGATLATTGKENSIVLWDVAKGSPKSQLAGLPAAPSAIAFAPDGKQLVSGSIDGTIHLWDLAALREITPVEHRPRIQPIAYLNSKVLLVKAGPDAILQHLDIATGKLIGNFTTPTDLPGEPIVAPNGKMLAQADSDNSMVRLWDIEKKRECHRLKGDSARPNLTVFSPDSQYLTVYGQDNHLRVWNTKTGKEAQSMEMPMGQDDRVLLGWRGGRSNGATATLVTIAHDNRFLVVLSQANIASVWELASGKERNRIPLGNAAVSQLILSPDGKLMATAGADDVVRVWDILRGKLVHGFVLADGDIRSLAFSPSSKLLAASSGSGLVILYDVANAKEKRRFLGHRSAANRLLFDPSGSALLSAGDDGGLFIWDVDAPPAPIEVAAELDETHCAELWERLALADAADAHQAMCDLSAHPAAAVTLFQKHLKPAPQIAPAHVQRLIGELGHPQFAQRDKASQELLRMGTQVVPALHKALEDKANAEAARRIKDAIAKLDEQKGTPENLRQARAVEMLERIASPEALALLQVLAGGAPNARLTSAATQSLERHQKAP